MKPEQINIAIAEFCGWIKDDHYEDGFGGGKAQRLVTGYKRNDGVFFRKLPDYFGDLNAMHEAEDLITHDDNSGMQYYSELEDVVQRWMIESQIPYGYLMFWVIRATAPQRAEALLRTIGKWVED